MEVGKEAPKNIFLTISSGRTYTLPKMGDFYELVLKIGNTKKDKKGIMGIFDEWYTTEFKEDSLITRIHRWRNTLAFDEFLNEINIANEGLLVYKANVWRYNSSVQHVEVIRRGNPWFLKVEKILSEYS